MSVDRCVCFNTTFSHMKEYALQHRCGLDELRDRFGCGRGCALCIPYVRAMLATGETEFPPNLTSNPTAGPDDL